MDPDLTYRDLRQDKIIEILFNIIRTLGSDFIWRVVPRMKSHVCALNGEYR